MVPATSNWRSLRNDKPGLAYLGAGLILLIVIKLAVAVLYGPIMLPDSPGYIRLADLILTDRSWLTEAGLAESAYPATVFRMLGYPLIIAVAKLVTAGPWQWLVVAVQSVVGLAAGVLVFSAALAVFKSHRAAIVLMLMHGLTFALLLDLCILTDSLYASLLVAIVALLVGGIAGDRKTTASQMLLIGVLAATALLLREGTFYLQLFLWPLILTWLWRHPISLRDRTVAIGALILPFIIVHSAYSYWNETRTGTAFLTTANQNVMLILPVKAARRGVPVFDGDTPLDQLAREHFATNPYFAGVVAINSLLFQDHNMTAVQIAAASRQKYIESWLAEPVGMASTALSDTTTKTMTDIGHPLIALDTLHHWATGEHLWPGNSEMIAAVTGHFHVPSLLILIGKTGFRILSALSVLCALFAPPIHMLTHLRRRFSDRTGEFLPSGLALMASLWFYYWGFFGLHVIVHMEVRYMAPIAVWPFFIALWYSRKFGNYRRRIAGAARPKERTRINQL